jgi:hypothetical protein
MLGYCLNVYLFIFGENYDKQNTILEEKKIFFLSGCLESQSKIKVKLGKVLPKEIFLASSIIIQKNERSRLNYYFYAIIYFLL